MDVTNEAVENLVTQFSSALDFYRELVQNSIDAGSSAIEIWLDFIPDEAGGAGGVIEIHVDDAGEGMNEAVIDEQLTTLFSSGKEHDLTKIGKFGIGFVSVFALRPRGVLVQTGRDGEYWEVFFDQDRSFFKSPCSTPIEGTQITLFLEGDRARYTDLVARSVETIDHWCRHSEAEINFEDRASVEGGYVQINKPFSVEGECVTSVEHEGGHIVLAYSRAPVWGFYNKGLALAVVRGKTDLVPAGLAHVAFRIKSRYLEHTLSRETVMRDENYDKAMARIIRAAAGPLRQRLVKEICALVRSVSEATGGPKRWTTSERGRYFELMGYLAREGADALEGLGAAPLLLGLDGRAYTLDQLCERAAGDGRVYVDTEPSALVEQLLGQGTPVIMIPGANELGGANSVEIAGPVTRVLANGLSREFVSTGVFAQLRDKLRGAPEVDAWVKAGEMIARPVDVLVGVELIEDQAQAQARALVARAWSVLERGLGPRPNLFARAVTFLRRLEPTVGYSGLVCARFHGAPGGRQPLFVVAHEVAPLMAIPTAEIMLNERPERPEAAVNCEHSHFRGLSRLAEHEPEMAAYCLAKALLLDENRGLELDTSLIAAALDPAFVSAAGGGR
ncbi:heat shock protein 90 [Enhygromyxa salina]|uniref:Heat shock protein 90 n=1 Tax=Enhygromyxa salina TaxID=215803 RepID=A0A2S9XYD8_9BACT|nr:ATP-binding protein [Enhygromyxa salina]PRP97874.1 heat shock protein 90 [Enhygromyxa salina]